MGTIHATRGEKMMPPNKRNRKFVVQRVGACQIPSTTYTHEVDGPTCSVDIATSKALLISS
jgi:hypothetical protein